MGIANPVTRETHGSGTHYHMQLAKQLGGMLQAPLEVGVSSVCFHQTNKPNFGTMFFIFLLRVTFLPLPCCLSGARRYDGSYRGVLSRQSCQRVGGDAHMLILSADFSLQV